MCKIRTKLKNNEKIKKKKSTSVLFMENTKIAITLTQSPAITQQIHK